MNKTVLKIFAFFITTAVLISMILLVINFAGFMFMVGDESNINKMTPKRVLNNISQNFTQTDTGFKLSDEDLIPDSSWCILINENGDIVWEQNKPPDIPTHYSINDIAVMSRWFLNDYPVYVRTEDYGLLVLGYPKDYVGKYDLEYSMTWFDRLPIKLLAVLILNICLGIVLACIFGSNMYRRLKTLTVGIHNLKREKPVRLKEKGIFRELSKNINDTSNAIEHKNALLAQRDCARQNWIAGISHDIRTPLSIILGYSEQLALNEETQENAKVISRQALKIKKLVEDLNLISSLEYDMQTSKKEHVRICSLLRRVVSDILNSGVSDNFTIDMQLNCEKAVILGDENLLERALFNIINNSIVHNIDGCNINIKADLAEGQDAVCIIISDNGVGVKNEILKHIKEIPKATHGLGLPMAYKIITAHGGKFSAYNDNGFCVSIELNAE